MTELSIVSWNVNGLRSYIIDNLTSAKYRGKTQIDSNSNLKELIDTVNPNIICFQETRCGSEKMNLIQIPDWNIYHSSSQGTGGRGPDRYSGVSIWLHTSLMKPIEILDQLPTLSEPYQTGDLEGRFLALRFEKFVLINTYVPNAGTNYTYRTERWDPAMLAYLHQLNSLELPIIWVGDLNIARTPFDVHFGNPKRTPKGKRLLKRLEADIAKLENPEENSEQIKQLTDKIQQQIDQHQSELHSSDFMKGIDAKSPAGFTRAERDGLEKILQDGYVDCWRHLHPELDYTGATWWNLRCVPYRPLDLGWRIDYIILNEKYLELLQDCQNLPQIGCKTKTNTDINKYGSDHCPIYAKIKLLS